MAASHLVLLLSSAATLMSASAFFFNGIHSNPDPICIMEHCAAQSASCYLDDNCRRNMECMISCGLTNHTCMYKCMNTYEDMTFDTFMKCLVDDYHCMKLQPPDPSFRCKPPPTSQVMTNFSMSMLEGSWYIVRGLNRDYDCFDCQISTYRPTPNSRNFTLGELYDVNMLNGSIRHRRTSQQMQQHSEQGPPAVIDSTDTLMGLTMYQEWYFLDVAANGNYAIVYYCGHMSSDWWYEGNLVYSREPTLGPIDVAAVAQVLLKTLGHNMNEYCVPNTRGCASTNTTP